LKLFKNRGRGEKIANQAIFCLTQKIINDSIFLRCNGGEKLETVHEFFAVTETSVYRVADEKDANGIPIVEKIVLREKSKIPVGGRLRNGNLVGIMKERIVLYFRDHRPDGNEVLRPEEANEWGGGTSPIIALFLNKEEAMNCSNSVDLKPWDQRWKKQTRETLTAIGDNHPVFMLSKAFIAPRVMWALEKRNPMKH
jgi:hypothetical protein